MVGPVSSFAANHPAVSNLHCQSKALQAQVPFTKSIGHHWQENILLIERWRSTRIAKSYRPKVSGFLHDAAVRCRKKTVVNGKAKWAAPQYVPSRQSLESQSKHAAY